jgi:putative endonuclease
MHYVYIIQSDLDSSFYKGSSEDPFARLKFHNLGLSTYTSKKLPWHLVAIFKFDSKSEALIKEKKLKKYPTLSLVALINSERNILDSFQGSLEKC